MNCPQCGSQLDANAKFCTNCGTKIETSAESAASAVPDVVPTGQIPPMEPAPDVSTGNDQDYTTAGNDKVKRIATDYFTFLWDSIKSPLTASAIDASHKLYGLLTMMILALVVPFLNLLRDMFYGLSSIRSIEAFGFLAESFGNVYLRIFINGFLFSILTYAASMALIIVVLFFTANLLKVQISFMDIAARFGAFMVIPTAIFILGSLVSLLSLSSLSSYINTCGMLGIAAAILFTFNTFKAKEAKLDTFYISVILLAASYLLYRIVLMIFS